VVIFSHWGPFFDGEKWGKIFLKSPRAVNQADGMDKLMTIPEVADYLKIGTSTLRRYIRRGYLRYIVLPGGDYRIRESEVKRFLDDRDTGS